MHKYSQSSHKNIQRTYNFPTEFPSNLNFPISKVASSRLSRHPVDTRYLKIELLETIWFVSGSLWLRKRNIFLREYLPAKFILRTTAPRAPRFREVPLWPDPPPSFPPPLSLSLSILSPETSAWRSALETSFFFLLLFNAQQSVIKRKQSAPYVSPWILVEKIQITFVNRRKFIFLPRPH